MPDRSCCVDVDAKSLSLLVRRCPMRLRNALTPAGRLVPALVSSSESASAMKTGIKTCVGQQTDSVHNHASGSYCLTIDQLPLVRRPYNPHGHLELMEMDAESLECLQPMGPVHTVFEKWLPTRLESHFEKISRHRTLYTFGKNMTFMKTCRHQPRDGRLPEPGYRQKCWIGRYCERILQPFSERSVLSEWSPVWTKDLPDLCCSIPIIPSELQFALKRYLFEDQTLLAITPRESLTWLALTI